MSDDPTPDETPDVQWEEDIPNERPEAEGGESQVDDEPLGVPEGGDANNAPMPGMPETEPPSSG
jgi:hypothetical protein